MLPQRSDWRKHRMTCAWTSRIHSTFCHAIRCVASCSHGVAAHFRCFLPPLPTSASQFSFTSFLLFSLHSSSFPRVSHIWTLTLYRHGFPKPPVCYYSNNTEWKGTNRKVIGRWRKNLVCITWEHRTQNNAEFFYFKGRIVMICKLKAEEWRPRLLHE